MVRRAGVGGRVDVCGRSPTRKEGVEEERVPGLGRSPGRPFCNPISRFLKMSPGFCNTSDAVNNNVQVTAAAGSHHLPIPWPWPTRWAGMGRSCCRGREGYKRHHKRLAIESTPRMPHQRSFARTDSYSSSVIAHAAAVVSSKSTLTNPLSNSSIASISFSAVASAL